MKRLWRVRLLTVLGASIAIDVILIPFASQIAAWTLSCGGPAPRGAGLVALPAFLWLAVPPCALIAIGLRDERVRHVPDALGLAMGAVSIVIVAHVVVFASVLSHGPSCGLF
jgi:hypothetical protein